MSKILNKAKDAIGLNDIKLAGHKVGPTGYGMMGLTWRPDPVSREQAHKAMKKALSEGANFWNGGEIYGPPERNSLHLLREYFDKYPEDENKVVVSIKGGCKVGDLMVDGSPENTRRSIEECIRVLGSKKLDLWESARVDFQTPIETTMREAYKYVQSGQIGGISLSECSAATIRRAAKVAKISAVEVEFSLWATEILSNGVAEACAELDIPIVAYSPLGRGFLTGQIKKADDIPEGDLRRELPRFQAENFNKNLDLVRELEKIAAKKGCKPGQVGLAWVRAQGKKPGMPTIIPIPGATTEERIEENMVEVSLTEEDLKEVDELISSVRIEGGRYNEHLAFLEFGESPELKE